MEVLQHRLLCGDATSAEAIARLLSGRKPHSLIARDGQSKFKLTAI